VRSVSIWNLASRQAGNHAPLSAFLIQSMNSRRRKWNAELLWLLGVPIPVIILLWLFFGR
jgi:hypothetical protein